MCEYPAPPAGPGTVSGVTDVHTTSIVPDAVATGPRRRSVRGTPTAATTAGPHCPTGLMVCRHPLRRRHPDEGVRRRRPLSRRRPRWAWPGAGAIPSATGIWWAWARSVLRAFRASFLGNVHQPNKPAGPPCSTQARRPVRCQQVSDTARSGLPDTEDPTRALLRELLSTGRVTSATDLVRPDRRGLSAQPHCLAGPLCSPPVQQNPVARSPAP